ncbi:MAG: glucose-6-phosphate isomerase, partial [Verrucomicrobiota bacterium]
VYGNKGSTDQHAYVQQLRDGLPHFFVTFIEVLKDRGSASVEVEPGITTGDYLQGFLLGTRQALFENGRESMTITIQDTSAFSIGVLIALYERAVGLYASLIEVNAYHQPGVEAGKKAATAILKNQLMIIDFLSAHRGEWHSLDEIVSGASTPPEVTLKICEHLASNPTRGIRKRSAKDRFKTEFQLS